MKKYLFVILFLVAVIFIAPNISLAATTAELQAQIAALLAQIQALQSQLNQQQGTQPQWCYDFKYNLNAQSSGKEVGQLQIALVALEKQGFEIDSYEKTSQTFGESTADAVVGFQQKYKDEILSPYNLKYGTGFVGKSTRAKLNSLYGCGVIRPIPIILTTSTQPVLSISPTSITVGNTYTFSGSVTKATPNSDVKLYLQRPDATMKYENYYVGTTDSNGVLKVSTTQTIPDTISNNVCCPYSAWVEVGGKKSNVVDIKIASTATKPSIKLPDLIISDFSWTPSYPKLGENITIYVKIKNIGTASAQNFSVTNLWDSDWKGIDISNLAQNEEITVQDNVGSLNIVGGNNIVLSVDVPSKVVESNEKNNFLGKIINVASSATTTN